MKSKLFLTVLLLAAITTIGISHEIEYQTGKDRVAARFERLNKMPLRERVEQMRIGGLDDQVRSLVAAKSVFVFVDDLNKHATSMGLTKEQLKADTESKLRLAGIKIASEKEWWDSVDARYLYVNVIPTINNSSPDTVYNVSVCYMQQAKLLRSPFAEQLSVTWGFKRLLSCPPSSCPKSEFPEKARQEVRDGVEGFINAYFKANPKK